MNNDNASTEKHPKVHLGRLAVIVFCLVVIAGGVVWYFGLLTGRQPSPRKMRSW